jgi:hypothetical protein
MPGNAAVDAGETVKASTAGVEPAAAGMETATAAGMETAAAAVKTAASAAMSAATTASRHRIGRYARGADGDACEQRKSEFGRFGDGTK